MSDLQIMIALIEQHAESSDPLSHMRRRVTESSAIAAAKALQAAGFRMALPEIGALSERVTRLEGWAGLTT